MFLFWPRLRKYYVFKHLIPYNITCIAVTGRYPMDLINLKKEPVVTNNAVRLTRGFDVARTHLERKTAYPTYLYLPLPGMLVVDHQERQLKARTVVNLQPGVKFRLYMADLPLCGNLPGFVFETLAEPTVKDGGRERQVSVDRTEFSSFIFESPDGRFIVYPEKSRLMPNGAKSGWFTHARKAAALAVGEGIWKAVRDSEVSHYHRLITEWLIPLLGTYHLQHGSDIVKVEAGTALVLPSHPDGTDQYHAIQSVEVDCRSGRSWHLSLNWPSIPGDPTERVVKPRSG